MALKLPIQYEQLIELVEQLSDEQQRDLLQRLLNREAQQRPLTVEEKLALYHASILHNAVNQAPSVRREDWYDDDGR